MEHYKHRKMLLVALFSSLLVSACAYVTAVPAPPGSNVSGIRIYEVKPILIVNGENIQIEMIPNYNRAYALRFGAFLAKNHVTADFENGFLTNIDANMDSTDFIVFLKEALKKLPDGFGLSGSTSSSTQGGIKNRFQVFDFVFDENGDLLALRPLINQADLVRVTTSAPPTVIRGANSQNTPRAIPQPPISPGPIGN